MSYAFYPPAPPPPGPLCVPEFIMPADATMLPPGTGAFTCCRYDHYLGNSPVICDKVKIVGVMQDMLVAKIHYLFEAGEWFEARYFAVLGHWFRRGLGEVMDDREVTGLAPPLAADGMPDLTAAPTTEIGRLRARLRWRDDDVEATWSEKTGTSLLFWAAAAKQLGAVEELIAMLTPDELQRDLNRGLVDAW